MLPAGFETEILASEQPQTHALDRAATTTGILWTQTKKCMFKNHQISLHLEQAFDRHRSFATHMAGQECRSYNPQNSYEN